MKKLPYHTTDSGIRIPKHKIKWTKPQREETPESSDLLSPVGIMSPNLFIRNLNFLIAITDGREPDAVIDVDITGLQGDEQNYG